MCGVTDEGEASADEPVGNVLGDRGAEHSAPFETVHDDVTPGMLPQVAFLGGEFTECGVRYVGGCEDLVDDVLDDAARLAPEFVAAGVVPGEADLAGPEAKSRFSTPRGQRCRPAITASSTRPSQMTYPAKEASAWPGGDGTAHDNCGGRRRRPRRRLQRHGRRSLLPTRRSASPPQASLLPQAGDQLTWQTMGVVKVVEVLLGQPALEPSSGEHLPTALQEPTEPALLLEQHP